MSRTRLLLFTGILAGALGAGSALSAQTAAQLPNGATSINETFGDWIVDCRINEGVKQCILLQSQGNAQTRQRTFEIQLHAPKDGKTEGTVLMPFGLKLDSGAVLTLDDKDLGQPLRFSTCMPQGCLMPVSFPAATLESLKKGKVLQIAALSNSTGEVVPFKVSLEGFATGNARVIELSK